MGAHAACQPLGHGSAQRRGDLGAVDAEIGKPRHRADGIVGVQRGQHEVTGEARLHRHLRRLQVPDLTHENHVGVLSQDRAQRRGEGHVSLRLDLDLSQPLQFVFHRVFDRHDVDLARGELGERRVEQGRLAGAGWTGDHHDAVAEPEQPTEPGELRRGHAEVLEPPRALGIEEADHGLLRLACRHGGDAQVERAARDLNTRPPVLRSQPVGDVQLAHDLDARDDSVQGRERELHEGPQHPVHAEPHRAALAPGLEVDVARPLAHRVMEDEVCELDDRSAFDLVRAHRFGRGVFDDADVIHELRAHPVDHPLEQPVRCVAPVDRFLDGRGRGDLANDRAAGRETERLLGVQVAGVRHRDHQLPVGGPERIDQVAARGLLGYERQRCRLGGLEVCYGQAVPSRDPARQIGVRHPGGSTDRGPRVGEGRAGIQDRGVRPGQPRLDREVDQPMTPGVSHRPVSRRAPCADRRPPRPPRGAPAPIPHASARARRRGPTAPALAGRPPALGHRLSPPPT